MLLLTFDSPDDHRTRTQLSVAAANLGTAGFAPPRITEIRIDGSLVACVSAACLGGGAVS